STLLALFEKVIESTQTPLIVIIDEFGKNLEYLSYHNQNGDLFILQQLAEKENVYLFVCLHQAFEDYLYSFSTIQQQEWNKVQGRFEEISYVESTAQMLHLIKTLLTLKGPKELHGRIKKWAKEVETALKPIDLAGIEYLDAETISSIYPLHPLTGLALVELCRRFAQNERTLVSFMTSGHIYALPAQMERIIINPNKKLPSIGLDCLYNYFFQLSHTSLAGKPSIQQLVEIQDKIESASQYTDEEAVLLKNIGVLNLLSGTLGLKASREIIFAIMEYSYCWPQDKIREILDSLMQRGVIFNREYAGELRLWEGSDFDLNEAIAKEKAKLTIVSLEELLEANLPLSPVVAARYALEKGITRKFERRWIDIESLNNMLKDGLTPRQGFDGLLLYCFGTEKQPRTDIPEKCSDGRPLVVAYAPVKEAFSEIVLELVSCRQVLDTYPQLVHDKVARKEINYRIKVARQKFQEHSTQVFNPGAPGLLWYIKGRPHEINNFRELSEKLSDLCYECYKDAPTIPNEIVSGEKISGAAVRARRELVEAMATNAEQENLGFTGWGPEVAMYKSLLLSKGLHRQNQETGAWYLTLESEEVELNKLWEVLDKEVEDAADEGITIEKMLNRLRQPPFGLRQGPALIYIALYILVKADNLTVFREGVYLPYLRAADMSLLLKRPALFTVKRFIADEMQDKMFAVYRNVLQSPQLKVDRNLRNATMLGIIGPLMKFVDSLPRYTKQTRNISKRALQARAAITNAVDPIKFLFNDLPEALEVEIEEGNVNSWSQLLEHNLRSVLKELSQAYEKLNTKIQEIMLETFSSPDIKQLHDSFLNTTPQLMAICSDIEMRPVLQALSRKEPDLDGWARGVAGAVVKKPVDAWKDDDLAMFKAQLIDYADRLEHLKVLAKVGKSENVQVISVMKPGGKIKREVVTVKNEDPIVAGVVKEIFDLPVEKRRTVLALLADKIIWGG
ncbi:MAG: hypothetical protein WBK42_10440, partial [Dethiobacteria bacterium]